MTKFSLRASLPPSYKSSVSLDLSFWREEKVESSELVWLERRCIEATEEIIAIKVQVNGFLKFFDAIVLAHWIIKN
jgi:hypothetical protein